MPNITVLLNDFTIFLKNAADATLSTIFTVAILLFVTWLLVRIAKRGMQKMEQRIAETNPSSVALARFVRHIITATIWFAGISTSITLTPLESVLNKLLAAGGVLAVVAGIASQEALGSMVSGLMILAFRPFSIGDVIRYVDNDISGVVEEITLRHTIVRTWENKRMIVPNSKMNSAIIENADYKDSRVCVLFDINITYESDLPRAQQLLARVIREHPSFLDTRSAQEKQDNVPDVLVRVKDLAASWVVLRAWLWAKDNGTAAAMKSDIMMRAKEIFAQEGIDLAYPHLTLVQK